jgi:hypothetical protein
LAARSPAAEPDSRTGVGTPNRHVRPPKVAGGRRPPVSLFETVRLFGSESCVGWNLCPSAGRSAGTAGALVVCPLGGGGRRRCRGNDLVPDRIPAVPAPSGDGQGRSRECGPRVGV